MSPKKIKRKLDKIFAAFMSYELNKLQTEKEIMEATNRLKKITEDIKNTPIT